MKSNHRSIIELVNPYSLYSPNLPSENMGISEGLLNSIHCRECVEFMNEELDEGVIDLTVTSPPYDNLRDYKGYEFDCEAIARGLYRVTKEGGVVVWVVGDKYVKGNRTLTSFEIA